MRNFDFSHCTDSLFTADIVNLLSSIHEYKGRQTFFIETKPELLSGMLEIAKIQSTEASNKIEGIFTTDLRLKEIVKDKAMPINRNEREIAGYRDVLAVIHENYDYITPRPNIILQLHRDLYAYSGSTAGGRFKNTDNIIEEIDTDGTRRVRFQPLPAFETPEAMEQLCNAFLRTDDRGDIDPLLLIPVFILDFLCIHPFNDGNGRMSRLLTLLLLYRAGYFTGKYISIELLIEKTKDSYYNVLQASSFDWHENKNDYKPFVVYYLGIILNAYKEFSNRVEYLTSKKMNAAERIRTIFENKVGKLTKKEIVDLCPDISDGTVERALNELVKNGDILKIGGGRYTSYIYNRR
ncbi:MAG: Fic family protein [Eubacteriales bacterium]